MAETFTRLELYELVWEEPATALSKKVGVSDVAISKACKRYNIPRPPMGHWAKIKAGKAVTRQPLPARGPGMLDTIEFGGSRYGYRYSQQTDEEFAASDPQPPTFEDEMDDVRSRAQKLVKKFSVPRTLEKTHRIIHRLLEEDEERRKEYESSRHPSSWKAPLFGDLFEQRRLRILNAIFTAADQLGFKPTVHGKEARDLGIQVNNQHVSFTLDSKSQKPDQWGKISIGTRGTSTKMRLALGSHHSSRGPKKIWEDHGRSLVEHKVYEVLIEIIIAGEQQHRDQQQWSYEKDLEWKPQAIEAIRKRKEEAAEAERERLAELEQGRVDRLLADAAALSQATEIRNYVHLVEERCKSEPGLLEGDGLFFWSEWALEQADRIDPVSSGRFMEALKDPS